MNAANLDVRKLLFSEEMTQTGADTARSASGRTDTFAFHMVMVAVSPGGTRIMGVPFGALPLCVGTVAC